MRAARTDKGVSAVGQLVSLKMLVEFPNYDIVASINKHLPAQIRVLGYTKVTAGFDARKHCDKRRYEYVLPAWAFDPEACRSKILAEQEETGSQAQPQTASDTHTPAAPPNAAAAGPLLDALPQIHTKAATDAVAEATAVAVASDAALPSIPGTSGNTQQPQATQQQSDATAALVPQAHAADLHASALHAAQPSNSAAHSSHLASGQATKSTAAPTAAPAEAAGAEEAAPGSSAPFSSTAAAAERSTSPNAFTFDEAAVAKLNSILKLYEGTHNFHNFTVRLEASDPSAKRYMLSCKCDGVFQIQVRARLVHFRWSHLCA